MNSCGKTIAVGTIAGVLFWFGVGIVGVVFAQGTTVTTGNSGTTVTTGAENTPASQNGSNAPQRIVFTNPSPYDTIMELLHAVLDAIVRILMPVIAIMFIVSGFLFVTAGGNEKKLEDAKKAFFGTIIGAAIVLGAWALATAIAGTIQGL